MTFRRLLREPLMHLMLLGVDVGSCQKPTFSNVAGNGR
jgi:hypothetical protein